MVMCSLHPICYIDRNARNKKEGKTSQDSSRKAVRKCNGSEKPSRFGTLKCFQRILFLSIFEIHEVWVWKLPSQEKLLGTLASIKCSRSSVLLWELIWGTDFEFKVSTWRTVNCEKNHTYIIHDSSFNIYRQRNLFQEERGLMIC